MTHPTCSFYHDHPGGDGLADCETAYQDALARLRFVCSGRGAGVQEPCSFTTDNLVAAITHFEATDHDVEQVQTGQPS